MIAPTYDALFDLRGQLEEGIGNAITSDLSTYTRLNAAVFQKDRPRVELICRIGTPLGHKKIITPTDRRHDMWNFSLSVRVITPVAGALQRNADESAADFAARQKANGDLHAQMVARVQSYLSQLQLASITDLVNFPVLTLLLLAGPSPDLSLQPQSGYESTGLNYTGQFGIRPDAWTNPPPNL
jgi:hypothetical protein